MSQLTLRIATRKSPLALWQAEHVKEQLLALHPYLEVELVTFVTKGDKILDVPLAKIGGKGLFIKELEHAILAGKADIAVHSTKDLPMQLPDGFAVPVFMQRADPTDALISNEYNSLSHLPKGGVVGTSSLRRQTQLHAQRPDLVIKNLRGNVGTRLNKLDTGEYDAIILATSGLVRLGLEQRITERLKETICLPAVGQGALAIETRADDREIEKLILPLKCQHTFDCISAERAMNYRLKGGCQVPIAGHATLEDNTITLKGLVANIDGSVLLTASASGNRADAESIGTQVAEDLLSQGADKILASFYTE